MAQTDYVSGVKCLNCDTEYEERLLVEGCPECRTTDFVSNVVPTYDYEELSADLSPATFGEEGSGVWAFPELLPANVDEAVTLGEGATPLLECSDLATEWDLGALHVKDESQTPTWSYKDRLSSVALTKAVEAGVDVVTIASTGNHGASTAAYASRADLESVIFTVPEVPPTMKTLMQTYGANVVATPTPEDRWTIMRECIEQFDWYPTGNYVSPPVGSNFYGIEGYKTIAYEICKDLDWSVPDWVVQPTAYADGLSGVWRGFKDLYELGFVDQKPRMAAVEPFGPLKNALEKDLDRVEPIEKDSTVAFSIGANVSTYQGLAALRESDGTAVTIDDDELREMQIELGAATGIYAEASAIAAVSGVKNLVEDGRITSDDSVVAVSTSTGLKDTETTAESLPRVPTIDPDVDTLRSTLRETYDLRI
jgi:threonine synthase